MLRWLMEGLNTWGQGWRCMSGSCRFRRWPWWFMGLNRVPHVLFQVLLQISCSATSKSYIATGNRRRKTEAKRGGKGVGKVV